MQPHLLLARQPALNLECLVNVLQTPPQPTGRPSHYTDPQMCRGKLEMLSSDHQAAAVNEMLSMELSFLAVACQFIW